MTDALRQLQRAVPGLPRLEDLLSHGHGSAAQRVRIGEGQCRLEIPHMCGGVVGMLSLVGKRHVEIGQGCMKSSDKRSGAGRLRVAAEGIDCASDHVGLQPPATIGIDHTQVPAWRRKEPWCHQASPCQVCRDLLDVLVDLGREDGVDPLKDRIRGVAYHPCVVDESLVRGGLDGLSEVPLGQGACWVQNISRGQF